MSRGETPRRSGSDAAGRLWSRRSGPRRGAYACALVAASALACERAAPWASIGRNGQSLIYGADDRVEASPSLANGAIVALIRRSALPYLGDAGSEASFGAVHGLCPGERFERQPALAECTGVLIAPDLVVTAAHCLDQVASCRDYVYVRNYYLEADAGVPALDGLEPLECNAPLIRVDTSILDEQDLDFAVLELAEPARAFQTPAQRRGLPRLGEAVLSIGTSGGLPVKATSGVVSSVRSEAGDYFEFTGDLFVGGSGSGVFDGAGALLGIHVRGGSDFEPTPEGCRRVRRVPDVGGEDRERANALGPILDAVCELRPELEACEDVVPKPTAPGMAADAELPAPRLPSASAGSGGLVPASASSHPAGSEPSEAGAERPDFDPSPLRASRQPDGCSIAAALPSGDAARHFGAFAALAMLTVWRRAAASALRERRPSVRNRSAEAHSSHERTPANVGG